MDYAPLVMFVTGNALFMLGLLRVFIVNTKADRQVGYAILTLSFLLAASSGIYGLIN